MSVGDEFPWQLIMVEITLPCICYTSSTIPVNKILSRLIIEMQQQWKYEIFSTCSHLAEEY